MGKLTKTKQTIYFINIIVVALLLAACSGNSETVLKEKPIEEKKVNEEKHESDTKEGLVTETESQEENQNSKDDQKELAISNPDKETITLEEFIDRWNEIDPGRLSEETQTMSVENGILTGLGSLGISDSYIFSLNQEDNMIHSVTLNLSFPLPEDGEGLGSIPDRIRILMDVLEPEVESKVKENMLSTLLSSRMFDITVSNYKVTYTVRNGDDRFYLDAIFNE